MSGRRPKLTPELTEQLCALIRDGHYLAHAAEAVGVHRSTVHRWLQRGAEAKSGPYRAFYDAFKKAEAELQQRCLERIQQAADNGTWQAAAWLLERRFPRYWSRGRTATPEERHDASAEGEAVEFELPDWVKDIPV